MTHRTLFLLLAAAALSAAGCRNGPDTVIDDTVTDIVAKQIAQNTGDDTAPIQINDLAISDADTRDDTEPKPVS